MEDKMARVAILQNIQTRYGEYAKQTTERREYEPINPDSEHGNATRRQGALAHGQRSARWSARPRSARSRSRRRPIDRAMQRVGELNTRIDAVKERIQGIDGGSLRSSARIFNACARTSTRRAGNVMP